MSSIGPRDAERHQSLEQPLMLLFQSGLRRTCRIFLKKIHCVNLLILTFFLDNFRFKMLENYTSFSYKETRSNLIMEKSLFIIFMHLQNKMQKYYAFRATRYYSLYSKIKFRFGHISPQTASIQFIFVRIEF